MVTGKLGNCSKCGRLYLRVRAICDDCFQKQEEDYHQAATYLRNNPGSTIQELHEATNVSIAQIRQFIWTGRIISGNFPNLSYPCEACGSMIQKGKTCSTCLGNINKLASKVQNEGNEQKRDQKEKNNGYISKFL